MTDRADAGNETPVWPRVPPPGFALTAENIAHFAAVPSYEEWAHGWKLEHGRPPTNEEISRWVMGEWGDG